MAKAFKTNKSTVDVYTTDEVYNKEEVDTTVETLEQGIADSYAISVINNDIILNFWTALFKHYNLDIKKPALIRNTANYNIAFKHQPTVESSGTYQVVYLLNGELKVVEAEATMSSQTGKGYVYFNDEIILQPNKVALYQFIDLVKL